MMKFVLSFLTCIILNGCGATPLHDQHTSSPPNKNSTINVLDKRPPQQKKSYIEEDDNGSNAYLGDNELNPNGPNSLKMFFTKKFKGKLVGLTPTITSFTVEVYKPAASLPYGDADNPLAGLVALAVGKLRSEKTVLVQISGQLNQSPFSNSYSENFKGIVSNSNIRHTINQALEGLTPQIQSILTNQ